MQTIFKKNEFCIFALCSTTMILAIDFGNSFIKCAVFEQNCIIERIVFQKKDLQSTVQNCLNRYKAIKSVIVSAVSNFDKEYFTELASIIKVHIVDYNDDFPFHNLYETPKTLGIDRMVLATGAIIQFPNQNRLVIDAGTCITYDFIDQKNNYLGGAIAPGLNLRYQSLHQHTANLPLLETQIPENLIGKSTNNAIHSGVVNGLIFEIDGFIDQFKAQNENFIIILTGGDTEFLAKRLKNTIFANSNFLLESLNLKFQYKTEK